MTQNQIAYHQMKETQRANRAQESLKDDANKENIRHNKVSEKETMRNNLATNQAAMLRAQNANKSKLAQAWNAGKTIGSDIVNGVSDLLGLNKSGIDWSGAKKILF